MDMIKSGLYANRWYLYVDGHPAAAAMIEELPNGDILIHQREVKVTVTDEP